MKCNQQPHKKHNAQVTQILASLFGHQPLTAQQFPLTHWPYQSFACQAPAGAQCAYLIINSNPLTFLQLNFQAPKPTLTPKPTRTRTGLSINLPRSWMPLALKSSGLLEQVSPSHVSQLFVFSQSVLSYITLTTKYLHLEWGHSFMHRVLMEQLQRGEKSSLQLMCGLHLVEAITALPTAEKLLPHGFYRGGQ